MKTSFWLNEFIFFGTQCAGKVTFLELLHKHGRHVYVVLEQPGSSWLWKIGFVASAIGLLSLKRVNTFKFCQPLPLASRETEKVQKTPFANDVVSTVITLNVVLPCTEPMRCEGLRNGSAGRKNVQAMKIARASKKTQRN